MKILVEKQFNLKESFKKVNLKEARVSQGIVTKVMLMSTEKENFF